jgi:hypothetical protein
MKAITNRIRKLEIRLSPQLDLEGYSLARILYERRRRRMEREGVAAEELPPEFLAPAPGFNPLKLTLSLAETLQRRRELREEAAATGARNTYR